MKESETSLKQFVSLVLAKLQVKREDLKRTEANDRSITKKISYLDSHISFLKHCQTQAECPSKKEIYATLHALPKLGSSNVWEQRSLARGHNPKRSSYLGTIIDPILHQASRESEQFIKAARREQLKRANTELREPQGQMQDLSRDKSASASVSWSKRIELIAATGGKEVKYLEEEDDDSLTDSNSSYDFDSEDEYEDQDEYSSDRTIPKGPGRF